MTTRYSVQFGMFFYILGHSELFEHDRPEVLKVPQQLLYAPPQTF